MQGGIPENKVAKKPIVTLDLASVLLPKGNISWQSVNLQSFLENEVVLRESSFRQAVSDMDWSQFAGKHVYVFCGNQAIIPMWAYMVVVHRLSQEAAFATVADSPEEALEQWYQHGIENLSLEPYKNKRVLVKGCGSLAQNAKVYAAVTRKLAAVTRALSFGEACSSVPISK